MKDKIKKGDLVFNANAPTFQLHKVVDAYDCIILIRYEHGILQRNLERRSDGDWRKPKPILFSTPMVQAILEDRKTQTRRIAKWSKKIENPVVGFTIFTEKEKGEFAVRGIHENGQYGESIFVLPYKVGDILYVRETWAESAMLEYFYKANGDERIQPTIKWRPSIHMPRAAARIFLKVIAVKAERLQDITEEDAIAEGIENMLASDPEMSPIYFKYDVSKKEAMAPGGHWAHCADGPIHSFESLWKSINGPESWNENPWVFAYTFERIEKPA